MISRARWSPSLKTEQPSAKSNWCLSTPLPQFQRSMRSRFFRTSLVARSTLKSGVGGARPAPVAFRTGLKAMRGGRRRRRRRRTRRINDARGMATRTRICFTRRSNGEHGAQTCDDNFALRNLNYTFGRSLSFPRCLRAPMAPRAFKG